MRHLLKAIVLSVLFILPMGLIGQSVFEINSVFRPRGEFRHGYRTLKTEDSKPASFISQRTRLGFNYSHKHIKTNITVFDYRVWGDQVWKKDAASLGIHEVWTQIRLNDYASVKVGRQELQYDNSRLLSAVNWNQIGATHDAVKLSINYTSFTLDLISTWNQNKENTFGTNYIYDGLENSTLYYKNLNAAWSSTKLGKFTINTLSIMDGYEHAPDNEVNTESVNIQKINYRYTSGLILDYKGTGWWASSRAFYQYGKLYNAKQVRAYYLNTDLRGKILKSTSITLGFEFMSGNKTDNPDQLSTAFDILYGARHKFNGSMDYFSTPATTKGAGLINPYAKANYSFNKQHKLALEYHHFLLQQDLKLNAEQVSTDRYLGQELDLIYTNIFSDDVQFSVGYSMIFGTDTMEELKGGDASLLNHWTFVMLTVNPSLLKIKND